MTSSENENVFVVSQSVPKPRAKKRKTGSQSSGEKRAKWPKKKKTPKDLSSPNSQKGARQPNDSTMALIATEVIPTPPGNWLPLGNCPPPPSCAGQFAPLKTEIFQPSEG